MKTLDIIIIIIALITGLPLAGCSSAHPDEEKHPKSVVEVKTAKVEIADFGPTANAPASVFPREQANIAARITARIIKLYTRKGDSVTAGQALATLENHDLLAQRDEMKATVADAEANLQKTELGAAPTDLERARGQVAISKVTLDQAQKIYDRRKDLLEKGAIPQRDLLTSETELAQAKTSYEVARKSLDLLEKQSIEKDIRIAQSRLDQARARLAEINAQIEFTEIRSPFTGVITDQMMFAGDMAKPDASIFTIMNLSVAIARAQTPEAESRAVRRGQACSFTPVDQAGSAFAGRVTVVNQAIDPARRAVEVWCEIPNGQRKLKGGEFGSLAITTGVAKRSVVAPVAAVQFAEDGKKGTVMVVDGKNIAHAKEVETGETIGGRVQIISGLSGGETVIVEGGYSLPDKTEVRNKEGKDEKVEGGKDKDESKDEKGDKDEKEGKEEKKK
ncbi:MAG: efflux RND transporter periplasmic adaptor subunit [Chloracidobacterium sp.]|nr:efflux RND transporter periplasmic adaptor subunit [Chloracidobacterium sp.]